MIPHLVIRLSEDCAMDVICDCEVSRCICSLVSVTYRQGALLESPEQHASLHLNKVQKRYCGLRSNKIKRLANTFDRIFDRIRKDQLSSVRFLTFAESI